MTPINSDNWWQSCGPNMQQQIEQIWIPIGNPGYFGGSKKKRQQLLDAQFGRRCWQLKHIVRGRIVSHREAMHEYEQSYRVYLQSNPDLVNFLTTNLGNVYDYAPRNVHDHRYHQPDTDRNHYQDISVRRVIAELVVDKQWPDVIETGTEVTALTDLADGQVHHLPRANGFRGQYLMEIRGPESAGFFLNPAVVPVYDPLLVSANPTIDDWYLRDGCGHLSVEAFWQSSKVITVRYDKFLRLATERQNPLARLQAA